MSSKYEQEEKMVKKTSECLVKTYTYLSSFDRGIISGSVCETV